MGMLAFVFQKKESTRLDLHIFSSYTIVLRVFLETRLPWRINSLGPPIRYEIQQFDESNWYYHCLLIFPVQWHKMKKINKVNKIHTQTKW